MLPCVQIHSFVPALTTSSLCLGKVLLLLGVLLSSELSLVSAYTNEKYSSYSKVKEGIGHLRVMVRKPVGSNGRRTTETKKYFDHAPIGAPPYWHTHPRVHNITRPFLLTPGYTFLCMQGTTFIATSNKSISLCIFQCERYFLPFALLLASIFLPAGVLIRFM